MEAAEGKREARAALSQDTRARVFARANGRCECCRSRTPSEWHHLLSGGQRRHREAYETTAALCPWCHVDLHKNKFHALAAMRRWAMDLQYAVALREIEHRIDKLREAEAFAARTASGRTTP